MNHELAKTLTAALVQFIDRERPKGTMCCSNTDCENIRAAFEEGEYDCVEAFIQKKLLRLTEFQSAVRAMITEALTTHIKDGNGREMSSTVFIDDDTAILLSSELLELAKKELLSYADERNPKIEAMADLERTLESNPEKLPQWLKNKLAKKHLEGYIMGKEEAKRFNPPAINIPTWEPPCYHGGSCTNPMRDCINCPGNTTGGGFSTSSGTLTAVLHGNTSATDGEPHNPSFTD